LASAREDAKLEIMECGVIEQCLQTIKEYPTEDIDSELFG
jgi:hypothetical protein